jgi:hypothetical protein
MHSLWFWREAITDSPGASQPDVQTLGAAKSTIVRFLTLALVAELVAGPAGEYLAAIENGNATPTSSRGT